MEKPSAALRNHLKRDDAFREGHRLCPGCLEATALHAIGRASDNGRKTVLALGTFCSQASTLLFPDVVAWGRGAEEPDKLEKTLGVIQAPSEVCVSVAEGVRDAADLLKGLGAWTGAPPNVVAVTGDVGGIAGGLESLLHTLHRGRGVTIFVLLHEVYGASHFPVPATSLASGAEPLDHLGLAVMSGASLVAQASPAYPALFAEVAAAALACDEGSVVFVPAPCLSGWRVDVGEAAKLSRLACETGVAPFFRKRRGQKGEVLNVPAKAQRPRIEEYLARQQRFEHLARMADGTAVVVKGREAEVAALQAWADGNVARLEVLAQ
jgi:pyruvate/2-oxoacid:ferredoxin oxidoreductase beta subunit